MEIDLQEYYRKTAEVHPRVHCITNTITIWDCANAVLAVGASPTMAHHPEEVAEITAGCHALVCNFGAMEDYDAMLNAAPVAAELGHPIVVDPVGCGGSSFRRARFKKLAETAQLTCVRGNGAEIRALAADCQTVTGVDDDPDPDGIVLNDVKKAAKKLAKSLHCIVIASGAIDVVTDGEKLWELHDGSPMMARITGSGCMLSCLVGAYLAAEKTPEAAVAACRIMGQCGERAAAKTKEEQGGTMTFHTHLIDELSLFGMA